MKTAVVNALLVGTGGFVGAVLRYGLGGLVHRQLPFATFPLGTLAVNLLGCFAIGALMGAAESRQLFGPAARVFLTIGLLGGFTTFSTFGYETLAMLRDAELARVAINVLVQVVGGLALVWLGYAVGMSR